jgi:hypothetical protein
MRLIFLLYIYRGEEARTRCLINAEKQSDKGDNVVLYKSLVQQCVQHTRTENGSGGERQSEHVRNVRSALLFLLQKAKKGAEISMRRHSQQLNLIRVKREKRPKEKQMHSIHEQHYTEHLLNSILHESRFAHFWRRFDI